MDMKNSVEQRGLTRPPTSFLDVLTTWANQQGSNIAYRSVSADGHHIEEIDYRHLLLRTNAVGEALRQHSAPGERAILMCGPGLDFIIGVLACLAEGIIAVPVFPAPSSRNVPKVERLVAIWSDATPSIVLSTTADHGRHFDVDTPWGAAPALMVDEFQAGGSFEPHDRVPIDPEAIALLQYTSGSTARPKGVALSQNNLLANSSAIQKARNMVMEDVGVFWLPPHHDMGLIGGILVPLYVGMTSLVMPPALFIQNPTLWLEFISEYRGSISAAPNFALSWCTEVVATTGLDSSVDLSSMRFLAVGAEPVRHDTVRAFHETLAPFGFPLTAIVPSYGLAEATLMVSCIPEGHVPRALDRLPRTANSTSERSELGFVSCGVPAPHQEVTVRDPQTGEVCREGDQGEVWVSGPSVAQGYWRNAEDTEKVFTRDVTSGTTWCRTGDEGWLLGGELFISGRLKEIITVRGQTIHPEDVEHLASTVLPAGPRVLCFGYDDGQREHVVVVVDGAAKSEFATIAEAVRTAVFQGIGMTPTAVLLVRERGVPLTTSGKVQRGACRQKYLAGELPVVAGWVDDLGQSRAAVPAPQVETGL